MKKFICTFRLILLTYYEKRLRIISCRVRKLIDKIAEGL